MQREMATSQSAWVLKTSALIIASSYYLSERNWSTEMIQARK
jgi:hypothetical protein